jgi:hypothetical protein
MRSEMGREPAVTRRPETDAANVRVGARVGSKA